MRPWKHSGISFPSLGRRCARVESITASSYRFCVCKVSEATARRERRVGPSTATITIATIHSNPTYNLKGLNSTATAGRIGNMKAKLLAPWNKTAIKRLPLVLLNSHVNRTAKGRVPSKNQMKGNPKYLPAGIQNEGRCQNPRARRGRGWRLTHCFWLEVSAGHIPASRSPPPTRP